jgi:NADPH:quinone reductase-like Zn-dependent oxidoreductase
LSIALENSIGLPQTYPLILGSEISGIVEKVGPDTGDFVAGDEVFGATNPSFINGAPSRSCSRSPLSCKMAGQTLSATDTFRRSFRRLNQFAKRQAPWHSG